MNDETKMLCIRIPENLRNFIKAKAYSEGLTLQDWIISLIENDVYMKDEPKNLHSFKTWRKPNEKSDAD